MLRIVVFLSGAATMALQMAIVRLVAPAIGASSIVWATLIGLSLLAMAGGYTAGGRLADHARSARPLVATLAAAAALVAMIPLAAPHLLSGIVDLHPSDPALADLVGAAAAYLALGFVPAVLLGVTPPFAIRHATREVERSGRAAGRVYALSTVGSIVGTLVTALLLVQWIGTRATILSIAASVLIAAVVASTLQRPIAASDPAASHDEVPAGAQLVGAATAIVIVEGVATMGTEMSIARLVAPFFGSSHAVWALIIAVVMGSIAIGSALGGRLIDRRPHARTLATLLAASAIAVALLPFAATFVMRMSTGGIDDVAVGVLVGTFGATLALLVIPVTLLGMVPPAALRLAMPSVERSGRTAGRLYAASTVGALVGTFASVLWLIPSIGTRRTMLVFALLLALAPLALARRPTPLVLGSSAVVVALLAVPTGLIKPLKHDVVLDERESRYQYIQTVEEPSGRRLLQLNEGWAVHSIWDPDRVLTGGIWDHFLVVPSLVAGEGRSMLVIGSAAGTAAREFATYRPDIAMTSVELDPQVTTVGRTYFHMKGPVTAADGRPFLQRTHQRWDTIHVDAYRQPYIPFYLTTKEFFTLVRARLHEGGVFSINVGSVPDDQRINEAVAATMRSVFPYVGRYRAEEYNEVIFGMNEPSTSTTRLRERIAHSDVPDDEPDLAYLFEAFEDGFHETQPDPDLVMTDDRAPVEWLTDRMIFGTTS